MNKITEHEGSKYLRPIVDPTSGKISHVDVYAVLEAFGVTCPAQAHAIKKLLMPGERGKGDAMSDLVGARAAVSRAVELENCRTQMAELRQKRQEEYTQKKLEESQKQEQKSVEERMADAKRAVADEEAAKNAPAIPMPSSAADTSGVMQIPLDKIGAEAVEIRGETGELLEKLDPSTK